MKVCILTETYYPEIGGGERQAQALGAGLVRQGIGVTVLTRRSRLRLATEEWQGQIGVNRLPPAGPGHLKKWGLALISLMALLHLRQQYDLIFVAGFRVLGLPAVIVSKLLGKVCVLKADSPGEMSGGFFADGLAKFRLRVNSPPVRLVVRWRNQLLRQAEAFVAISTEVASELDAQGVPGERIQTIPNCVDTARFRPVAEWEKSELRRKLGLPQDETIVIYTGRLVTYKGLPLLLRVWRDHFHRPGQLRLVLVGSGGLDMHNCEAELTAYTTAHGLAHAIQFTGSVDNVHEYLQAADLFVLPTEREAFGVSLVEAMACGLPAIATSVGGIRDIIQDGQNGLLIAAADAQQLSAALERLLADRALAHCLGEAAYRCAQQRYSQAAVIQKYVELFQRLTTRPRSAQAPALND